MKSWSMRIDGAGATLEKVDAPKPELRNVPTAGCDPDRS